MRTLLMFRIIIVFVALLPALSAFAICDGDASIVAEPTTDPTASGWTYTLTIRWIDTFNIHHWVVPLDPAPGSCACTDFQTEIIIPNPSGTSGGVPDGCAVPHIGSFACNGDPYTVMSGKLMLFTPDLSEGCELDNTGLGIFQFQSDLPPVPIAEGLTLIAAGADPQGECSFPLVGVFPAMACNPVSAENMGWGTLKSHYR